jgi:hypothetical protein
VSLDALRIALQGAGFPLSPIQLAVQGLLEELRSGAYQAMLDAGRAGKHPQRDYLSENLKRQQEARDRRAQAEYNLTRLHQDDQDAVEFIMALLNTELLDG